MIRFILFVFLILFTPISIFAQFGPQQIISTSADLPISIETGDINGDGTIDVISAARATNNIAWYNNTDGLGDFGELIFIDDSNELRSISVADIDGDLFLDILVTAYFSNKVIWYKNLSGTGNFSSENVVSESMSGAYDIKGEDVDGDGDIDIIVGTDNSGLNWFENIDGLGNFSNSNNISITPSNRSIDIKDIDGDGDFDIITARCCSVILSWYENLDGQGNFGSENQIQVASPQSSVNSLLVIDLDNDLDLDIVTTSAGATKVSWYENLDGQGNFGSSTLISDDSSSYREVYADDLDNDGDNDIIVGTVTPDEIAWFSNDGNGNFGDKQLITNKIVFPRDIITADLDDDGDMDVVSASQNDDKIAWYENLTILSNEVEALPKISVTPNPVKDRFHLTISSGFIDEVNLYTVMGEELSVSITNNSIIDTSSLSAGIYFLKVSVGGQTFVKKIIKD